jgi:3-hydroxyisobutyrate dehydrogenase
MVMNLLKAGFEVSVFNRTKEKEAPLLAAGAKSASSLQELMETCDVVLTMLSNDAAVKEVFEGPKVYCLQHLRKNHHQYEYVVPETSRYLNTICNHHVHFIDAPVWKCAARTLVILVGASNEDFSSKPIFDVLGKIAIHVGEPGWQVG